MLNNLFCTHGVMPSLWRIQYPTFSPTDGPEESTEVDGLIEKCGHCHTGYSFKTCAPGAIVFHAVYAASARPTYLPQKRQDLNLRSKLLACGFEAPIADRGAKALIFIALRASTLSSCSGILELYLNRYGVSIRSLYTSVNVQSYTVDYEIVSVIRKQVDGTLTQSLLMMAMYRQACISQ